MSATDWNELDRYETLVSQLRANAPLAPESLRERVMELTKSRGADVVCEAVGKPELVAETLALTRPTGYF